MTLAAKGKTPLTRLAIDQFDRGKLSPDDDRVLREFASRTERSLAAVARLALFSYAQAIREGKAR